MEHLIIGLLVVGLLFVLALLFSTKAQVIEKKEIIAAQDVALQDLLLAPRSTPSALISVPDFELKSPDEVEEILSGCNRRDPVLCAALTLLHQAKAEAAEESNDPRSPEWLTRKADGGLQYLMQLEADIKETVARKGGASEE